MLYHNQPCCILPLFLHLSLLDAMVKIVAARYAQYQLLHYWAIHALMILKCLVCA
ncbi:MAG TPA: hypothetical protein PKW07_02685 [Syntrophorhabdaceae bacterium]|nr:hypothetical protein [Syntrophorhabdaceae bacterium]